MIYFDINKNAYGDLRSINPENIVFTCSEEMWLGAQEGKYVWSDSGDGIELVPNLDYDRIQAEKELQRIGNLTCTKRVFALTLQEMGIDYLTQLKPLIESNPKAQLEWDLCVELLRSNTVLDQMAAQLGITSKQLDNIFLFANGEITREELK